LGKRCQNPLLNQPTGLQVLSFSNLLPSEVRVAHFYVADAKSALAKQIAAIPANSRAQKSVELKDNLTSGTWRLWAEKSSTPHIR